MFHSIILKRRLPNEISPSKAPKRRNPSDSPSFRTYISKRKLQRSNAQATALHDGCHAKISDRFPNESSQEKIQSEMFQIETRVSNRKYQNGYLCAKYCKRPLPNETNDRSQVKYLQTYSSTFIPSIPIIQMISLSAARTTRHRALSQ